MRNFLPTTLVLFFITAISFAQNDTIERGSYLFIGDDVLESAIKLNLLENNKYELVYWKGDYEVKQDSLLLKGDEFIFDVDYTYDEPDNSGELKVTFTPSLYKGVYIGTQNGTGSIEYQRLTDIEYIYDKNSVYNFKIDHTQFLYLVYEGYDSSESSKVVKYEIPAQATGVIIKHQPYSENLELKGFFDKKNKEILISGLLDEKHIATFKNEKVISNQSVKEKVLPLENKKITNWTYPGKEASITENWVEAADSAVAPSDITTKIDFKLKVESSLAKAIKVTKAKGNKFLFVYYDSNNKEAKSDFDAFIKRQEGIIAYNFYEGYDSKFDMYNYYLATGKDKNWLKKNKISNSPSIIILDEDGTVLATAKSNLNDKQYQFFFYDLNIRFKKASALKKFERVLTNKNANDAELIKAFKDVLVLLSDLSEIKYFNYYIDDSENYITVAKGGLDEKQVQLVWENIIKTHEKDVKPNMILVELILEEIQERGFNKQVFLIDKVLNDTDFKSIDYLIKHYDEIEAQRAVYNANSGNRVVIGDLRGEISDALKKSTGWYVYFAGQKKSSLKKIIEAYKNLISSRKGDFGSYKNYFYFLKKKAVNGNPDNLYLKEFDAYFNTNLAIHENAIESLDAMYNTVCIFTPHFKWGEFKEYYSNLCNDVAWFTVLHSNDATFIKKAIKWSEFSLVVKKNDPDYLNTLAELYYKDGQKERAIKMQQRVVELFKSNEFGSVIKKALETLAKMQNGTY
ncbi:hypothetical protein LNQ49_10135 [Flavobacterium sp. F-65]|uniref:Tetratricopeptide repeat-containing protein n=1 Tax=Flavobacterium pisciphilum TaxID=2893755 RepID=A0ABS8MT47_9FLAO|nr:hypothetical protein [Flavobacterium sp. F-65]MCC9071939.1 hypothetical protein [Flavobacterium sp. F-65]